MTSSLVGSEMCIRDRPRAGYNVKVSKIRPRSPYNGSLRSFVVKRKYSVSYTHLTLPTICSV
eukprot:1367693-Prorocentrum_lima.AAC.1